MSVIKQISIHNGNSWGNPYDIGANAENVSLINNGEPLYLAGSDNVRGALSNILPSNPLGNNTVVVTDDYGRLNTSNSNISYNVLNTALAGASATTSLQSQINTLNASLSQINISNGGTGATNFSGARKNLGITHDVLGSGDDLDSLTGNDKVGFYQITTGVTNAPLNWCWLVVVAGAGTAQLILAETSLYCRVYTGSPLAWTNWKEYTPLN